MNIYLFGKTSLSGEAFYELFKLKKIKMNIYPFSRKDKNCYEFNLKEPRSFSLINNEEFKIISFAPIRIYLIALIIYYIKIEKS